MLTYEEKTNNFYNIINQFKNDKTVNEIFENNKESPTFDDFIITAIVIEHVLENYKPLTLSENVWQIANNVFINEEVYNDLYEMLLDETIGGVIARATTAPLESSYQKLLAQRAADKAKNKSNISQNKSYGSRLNADAARQEHDQKVTDGSYGNDVKGYLKQAGGAVKTKFSEYIADRDEKNAANRQQQSNVANQNLKATEKNIQKQERKTNKLGQKIDNAIQDPIHTMAQGSYSLAKFLAKSAIASFK